MILEKQLQSVKASFLCSYLFSIPLGLDVRVQTPNQRHTVPRLSL